MSRKPSEENVSRRKVSERSPVCNLKPLRLQTGVTLETRKVLKIIKKKTKNAWRLSILSEDKIRVEAEGGGLPHLQPPQRAQGK